MSSYPAFGRVFCYNNTRKKKNFCRMKNWEKVALGLVGLIAFLNFASTERGRKERCGRVRNMEFPRIPNNGGL